MQGQPVGHGLKPWSYEGWNLGTFGGCIRALEAVWNWKGSPLPKNMNWWFMTRMRQKNAGCCAKWPAWLFEVGIRNGAPHLKMPGEFQASQPTAEIGLNHWWILMIPMQTWLVGPWKALNSVTCSPFLSCIIDDISSAMRLLTAT